MSCRIVLCRICCVVSCRICCVVLCRVAFVVLCRVASCRVVFVVLSRVVLCCVVWSRVELCRVVLYLLCCDVLWCDFIKQPSKHVGITTNKANKVLGIIENGWHGKSGHFFDIVQITGKTHSGVRGTSMEPIPR